MFCQHALFVFVLTFLPRFLFLSCVCRVFRCPRHPPQEKLGINLHCVDAKERFLTLLDGCTEPEAKRKIIGKTFIHVFQVRGLENRTRYVQFTLF